METSKIFRLKEEIAYSDNSVVRESIIKKDSGSVTLFAFDMGQGLKPHVTAFDAFVQILEGECEFSIEDKKFPMTAGDCIILPAGIVHAVESKSRFKMLLTKIGIPKQIE